MGSPPWAQSWRSGGSLWGRAVSRLHLDWATRLFQEDEEMLVLTQSDELNRVYNDNNRVPPCLGEDGASMKETATASTSRTLQDRDGETFTGTRASGVSSPRETLTTNTRSHGPERSAQEETQRHMARGRTEEEEGDMTTTTNKKRKSYRLAQKNQSFPETGKEKDGEEEVKRRRGSVTLEAPVQSPRTAAAHLDPSSTITAWEAGWNVTNAIQGIFVLGLPLALVRSGLVGVLLLVVSAWVCNHTGRSLVACLYEEEQRSGPSGPVLRVRVRRSYQDVMEACCQGLWPEWAGVGGCMLNVAQVVELVMTCTLYLLVSTSLLADSLSGAALPRPACSLLSLLFVLPCLLLTDLRPVSTLSLMCTLAHALISLLVMLYCLSRASSWSWSVLSLDVDPEDFIVSVGVIIFSYTSQIFLPPLEGSMEDRGQFDAMLGWTHGAACVTKTTFSLLAVLTWGVETCEVVTDNLPPDLRPLVNLCLLAKALLSYPLPFYSAAEILQACVLPDAVDSSHAVVSRGALALRGALLMTSYLLALLVPRFSLLMGLTGSVTGAAMTLILPCLFHLRLRWRRLTVAQRLVDAGILGAGTVCSVAGVVCSVRRLLEGL